KPPPLTLVDDHIFTDRPKLIWTVRQIVAHMPKLRPLTQPIDCCLKFAINTVGSLHVVIGNVIPNVRQVLVRALRDVKPEHTQPPDCIFRSLSRPSRFTLSNTS